MAESWLKMPAAGLLTAPKNASWVPPFLVEACLLVNLACPEHTIPSLLHLGDLIFPQFQLGYSSVRLQTRIQHTICKAAAFGPGMSSKVM